MPKFRVKYTREGLLSFLSHLHIIRLWQRAFARAEISVQMTQGYSPRPKLAFGPPLSVGHTSETEYLDVDIDEAISARQLIDRINDTLPEGIRVVHARRARPRESAISASIKAFIYTITVPGRLLGSTIDEAVLRAETRLAHFMDKDELVIERPRKGRIQHIDLRRTATNIVVVRDNSNVSISITIDLTHGASPKPEEVLLNVFGIDGTAAANVRIRRIDAVFRSAADTGRANKIL